MARLFFSWLILLVGWAVGTFGELYGVQHYVLSAEQPATQLTAFIVVLIWIFGIAGMTLWLAFKIDGPHRQQP
jgi:hypothetical protein